MQEIAEDILREASDGDLRAFEEIYQATAGFVYNVALRVTTNKEDAEDVTQEVFLNLYNNLKNFRNESSFKTWVYRITVNCAINFAKKRATRRNKTVEFDEALSDVAGPNEVHKTMDKEEQNKMIETLLNSINPEQRACVVLRNIEGLSYEQISQALNININTVRSRLNRAREKMLSLRKQVAYERL